MGTCPSISELSLTATADVSWLLPISFYKIIPYQWLVPRHPYNYKSHTAVTTEN